MLSVMIVKITDFNKLLLTGFGKVLTLKNERNITDFQYHDLTWNNYFKYTASMSG